MTRKEPEEKDPVKEIKASAFNWLFLAFYSILGAIIIDMRSDIKSLKAALPQIEVRLVRLEVGRSIDRYRVYELMPGKHEGQYHPRFLNSKMIKCYKFFPEYQIFKSLVLGDQKTIGFYAGAFSLLFFDITGCPLASLQKAGQIKR